MERNNVITTLEVLRTNCSKHSRDYQALEYAISSLKTDEAYQIMYEGGEIYTKADIVAMLTELRTEIEELDSRAGYDGNGMPTFSTDYIRKKKVNELIQQKIDKLKERTDGMV